MPGYDPFARGRFPVGVRTIEARDTGRNRLFPCEMWYPAAAQHGGEDASPEKQDIFTVPGGDSPRSQMAVRDATGAPGTYPLVIFSHASRHHRRGSTFLCTHLSSHGYVVAALDHSEVVAAELAASEGEAAEQRAARVEAVIANRVPDIRFLLDHLLQGPTRDSESRLDPGRIGIVGHSFGGWTALAAPEVEERIHALVALAPGGSSRVKPGILPLKLTFGWGRDVPTLYLVAENDASLPLAGMYELFERTRASKRMVILRRADHAHFMDDVEAIHESFRTSPADADLAEIQKAMLPVTELTSAAQAHLFVRGLAQSHLDAILKGEQEARRLLAGDLQADLAALGVDARVHNP